MTQCEMVLDHMKRGKEITPLKALVDFGIMRLAARIYDLKEQGHIIKSRTIFNERNKKHYESYSI